MIDGGHAGHASKEIAVGTFRQQRGAEVNESLMDVMLRDCRRDAVNVSDGHGCAFHFDPDS